MNKQSISHSLMNCTVSEQKKSTNQEHRSCSRVKSPKSNPNSFASEFGVSEIEADEVGTGRTDKVKCISSRVCFCFFSSNYNLIFDLTRPGFDTKLTRRHARHFMLLATPLWRGAIAAHWPWRAPWYTSSTWMMSTNCQMYISNNTLLFFPVCSLLVNFIIRIRHFIKRYSLQLENFQQKNSTLYTCDRFKNALGNIKHSTPKNGMQHIHSLERCNICSRQVHQT